MGLKNELIESAKTRMRLEQVTLLESVQESNLDFKYEIDDNETEISITLMVYEGGELVTTVKEKITLLEE